MMFWTKSKKSESSLSEIKSKLEEDIKGQELLKRDLLLCISDFQKYMRHSKSNLQKKNVLLIGPTGSGKTLSAQCIASILGVPSFQIDCSTLVRSGYVGQSLTDCQKTFNSVCNEFYFKDSNSTKNDLADKYAVVVLDEIDKLNKEGHNSGSISTTEVQNQLLAYLGDSGFFGEMRAKNILYIATGTFSSHYSQKNFDYAHPFSVQDACSIGFSPEIYGRFRTKIYLQKPDRATIKSYLLEDGNSPLNSIKESLKIDGNKFEVSDDTLEKLVEITHKSELGMRGVDSIIHEECKSICYDSLFVKGKTFSMTI